MSDDRFTEQYRQLITNPEARAALLEDPKAALTAYFGAVVEGDYRIEIIEQRSDTITAVIPAPPDPGTDPEVRLGADEESEATDQCHQPAGTDSPLAGRRAESA